MLSWYRTVVSSIAFYPTLISVIYIVSAVVALVLEKYGVTEYLKEHAPLLVVTNLDTARSMLSTLIGGLISLMVFSFSMVMILLNQASTNYSPRLLPGLISNRRHQLILGVYLGSIIFCILILISTQPEVSTYQLSGFAVLLAIVSGIACLLLFIYFIHSISQEIQVGNILNKIFRQTESRLHSIEPNSISKLPSELTRSSNMHDIAGDTSGYFSHYHSESLIDLAEEYQTVLHILPVKGLYILQGTPLLRSQKSLTTEQEQELLQHFQYYDREFVEQNYILGFKQITEIAVRAMSPGINDPGTAINAIDYLTLLFKIRLNLGNFESYGNRNEEPRLFISAVSFKDLLYNVMASLRQYCKHDAVVMQRLAGMLNTLKSQSQADASYQKVIQQQIELLLADGEAFLKNHSDLDRLRNILVDLSKD